MYPVHTKQAAQESWTQFQEQKNTYAPVLRNRIMQKFAKAADTFGLSLERPVMHITKRAVQFSVGNKKITMGKPVNAKEVLQMAMNIEHLADTGSSTADLRKMAKVGMAWASDLLGRIQPDLADRIFDTPVMRKVAYIAGLGSGDKEEICSEFLKRADIVAFSEREKQHIYKTYKHIKELPNQEFYKQASLDVLCDTLDKLDANYHLTHLYKSGKLKEPRTVCYKSLIQDLQKRASDFLFIPSTGTVLSKKALLERKNKVEAYFQRRFGEPLKTTDDMFTKVASLKSVFVGPFIDEITANG